MRRRRNEADIAFALAVGLVPRADGHEAGILALAAGIGLQGYRIEAGDLAQPVFQLFEQLLVALRLLKRHERMHVGEVRPADRDHLGGGIELHGA
jgi:hypothetical protein